MRQSDFLKELKVYINKTAGQRDPNITANAIYFITKQYPDIKDNKKIYIKMLKEVKKHLTTHFNWRMVEVHSCFCVLRKLLKYL